MGLAPPVPDCITVEEDRTEPGAALCPERYDEVALGQIRASNGTTWRPIHAEPGRPGFGHLQTAVVAMAQPRGCQYTRKVLSVDCTFTATETSDFVAIACLGQREDGTFDVIDVLNQMWSTP